MAKGFGFDSDGVRRIAQTVRAVENDPDHASSRRPRREVEEAFWIQLTGEGTGSLAGWYSWKLVVRKPSITAGWEDWSPAITGTTNARDANGATGLTAGKRYQARLNGYDSSGNPVYLFAAASGGGVTLYNNDVAAVTNSPHINIDSTLGMNGVMEFVGDTVGTSAGGRLQLKDPGGTGAKWKGIFWNGSSWVLDYVRCH